MTTASELADEIERLVALTESSHIAEARQAAKGLGAIMFDRKAAILTALRRVDSMTEALEMIAAPHDGGSFSEYDSGYIDARDDAAKIARQALTPGEVG